MRLIQAYTSQYAYMYVFSTSLCTSLSNWFLQLQALGDLTVNLPTVSKLDMECCFAKYQRGIAKNIRWDKQTAEYFSNLSLSLSLPHSVSLSLYLTLYLYLFPSLYLYLFISLSFSISFSISLSLFLSFSLSFSLSLSVPRGLRTNPSLAPSFLFFSARRGTCTRRLMQCGCWVGCGGG